MPCQLWANPTTSHPPVTILASRSAASLDSAPVVSSSTFDSPGASPASASARSITGRDSIPEKRWSRRPIISRDDGDDLGMGVPEDGAHLAAREVEHPPAGGVLDERPGRPLGDERRPRRAVAHEVALGAPEIRLVGHRRILVGRPPARLLGASGCGARSVRPMTQMEYRRLGRIGIKVSALSFGSWVTFDAQLKDDLAMECMQAAYDAGCNFFDNAEAYAGGESEAIMGRVIAELGWPRLVVRADDEGLLGHQRACRNMQNTLNRKYLMHAIDGSLERFGLDFVDVLYCHRADPDTAARGDGVGDERHHLGRQGALLGHAANGRPTRSAAPSRSPSATTCTSRSPSSRSTTSSSASASSRSTRGCSTTSATATTIWSPLASGLLTGKYRDGIPDDSRGAVPGYGWLADAAVRCSQRWPRSSGCGRSPTSSAARWPSWRWRGARRTRTCRP